MLVGGRSSRMGRDKALLPYQGGLLAQSVAQTVTLAAGSAILVGDPGLYGTLGYPVIPDIYPGEGPLGGILSALRNTPAEWNLVTACDMPGLAAEFLCALLNAAETSGADVLIPEGPAGLMEPLCAVYHQRSRQPLSQAFAAGIRKVTAAFEGIPIATLSVAELTHFQNVNTPEDWAAYAAK